MITETQTEQQVEAIRIGSKMSQTDLPSNFVVQCVRSAMEHEGVLDLMMMWSEAEDQSEKEEIESDLQDCLDDVEQTRKVESTFVRFDDLETIGSNIMAFKDSLRLKVEERGGLRLLAEKTGIPQPSLSRFFSSGSMPRRVTLLKIAQALNLSRVDIATEWIREG